jgi:DNA repair and recombination RAD54-like protein
MHGQRHLCSTVLLLPSLPLHQVLIISYETFRLHAERFQQPGSCDLLICDE